MNTKDSPGVAIPPPLIYAAIFVAAVLLQKKLAIDASLFHSRLTEVAGIVFLLLALPVIVSSMIQFIRSRNTIMTIKEANSLQTTGIYQFTRNPMYLGLVLLYLSLTCFIGNWWNLIFLPFLLLIVQEYIIKREERYLVRRFGQDYLSYNQKVRRWI